MRDIERLIEKLFKDVEPDHKSNIAETSTHDPRDHRRSVIKGDIEVTDNTIEVIGTGDEKIVVVDLSAHTDTTNNLSVTSASVNNGILEVELDE